MIGHATPLADWIVIAPVLLALLGGAVLLVLRRFLVLQPLVGVVVLVLIVLSDALLLKQVLDTGPLSMTMGGWLPPFGISFTADVMGAMFALAAAVVALVVALYLLDDAPESAVRDGLWPLLLLLMAGVSGAFLTGDLFNLYVWFEVMLIASFGLIALSGTPLALDGAVKYGVINFIGTTLFLTALGLLYGDLGTLNMADIVGAAAKADPVPLTAIAALFALAFGIKAAIFPVNAWLPASYHVPPAAISALMGAILTKVGAYAFARLMLMLLPVERALLAPAIETFAIATMILGPLSAIAETNPRRAIGFILIGSIGTLILCVANAQNDVIFGHMLYVVQVMPVLAATYLVAGIIEKGTTNTMVSAFFLALLLSLAGVPPFLGFWPKLIMLQGFIGSGDWLSVFALLLSSLLILIAGARLWSRIFWRAKPTAVRQPIAAPALLTLGIVALGLFPSGLIAAASIAAADILAPARYIAAVGLSP